MRRIWLAFVSFFRVLLGRPLPAELLPALPERSSPAAAPPPAEGSSGAIALLALLQREGRLVDFLKEDIADYTDEQIGAAVRAVHKGCRKVIAERVALEAVLEGDEGGPVRVDAGFDPDEIRLTGAVGGAPPIKGTLRHPGWRATKLDLPRAAGRVVAPAEVES